MKRSSTVGRRRASWSTGTALLTIASLVVVVACGDVYADLDGVPIDTTADASVSPQPEGGSATFPSDPIVACAARRPRENTACSTSGMLCEYGKSADSQCNAELACVVQLFETFWEPRPHDLCFSNVCPATADVAALDGTPCGLDENLNDAGPVTDADEAVCNVTDGVCACTTGRGGTDRHPRQWVCIRPISVCPPNRPFAGQPCVGNLWCDYGSCKFKRGLLMECKNGVWLAGGAPCQ